MKPLNSKIASFVLATGERYSLLVDRDSGLPLFYPNLYATTQVRNGSKSVAAMDSALNGIAVLLQFCNNFKIDLEARILKSDFFTPFELDALRDQCQIRLKPARCNREEERVVALAKGKKKATRPRVGAASEYLRLSQISKYLDWLAGVLLRGNVSKDIQVRLEKMRHGIEARRPSAKGRNLVGREKGLSESQQTRLLEIIQPGSELNPFDDPAVQARNKLMIDILLHLGIRGGELLNIKLDDIDWHKHQIVIARRPDELLDPRRRQPLVKTLDRRLPVKGNLIQAIHRYAFGIRKKLVRGKDHGYLFVAHKRGPAQGQPLSISGYCAVIKKISTCDSLLRSLHGHQLRHTWNNKFSEFMDGMENPPSPEDQERQRSYLQGWKPGSGSAATYTQRFVRERAAEASLALQQGISRLPEGFQDD